MSDDSPKRLQCPPEVPDAFAYASGYINGQAARRRGATAKAEQPSPQAIRARKVTEQLIADLWSGRDAAEVAFCSQFGQMESDKPKVSIEGPSDASPATTQAVRAQDV